MLVWFGRRYEAELWRRRSRSAINPLILHLGGTGHRRFKLVITGMQILGEKPDLSAFPPPGYVKLKIGK